MAAGQVIGGRLGAHLAINKGARLIRPLFLSVVSVTIAALGYKTYLASTFFTRVTQQYGMMPQIIVMLAIVVSIMFIYVVTNKRLRNPV